MYKMKNYYALMLFFLIFSCVTVKENGSMFIDEKEKIENFDTYNFSKEDLVRNFGEPTFELEDGTWLYYSYKTKNLNFLREKINEEHILFVRFDKNDKITGYVYKHRDNLKSILDVKIDDKSDNDNTIMDMLKGIEFTPLK